MCAILPAVVRRTVAWCPSPTRQIQHWDRKGNKAVWVSLCNYFGRHWSTGILHMRDSTSTLARRRTRKCGSQGNMSLDGRVRICFGDQILVLCTQHDLVMVDADGEFRLPFFISCERSLTRREPPTIALNYSDDSDAILRTSF